MTVTALGGNSKEMADKKLIIGLTGGIGSGKSAAAAMFAEAGVTVVDDDVLARQVVEPGTPALQEIAAHFGAHFIQADGTLDRAALRRTIFSDPDSKRWLEGLLHPLIRQHRSRALQGATSPYAILVSPLLLESGSNPLVDRILVIDVPEHLQIARTVARDLSSSEEVSAIMATQLSRAERLAYADDVVVNDGDLAQLRNAVLTLHAEYGQMAQGT